MKKLQNEMKRTFSKEEVQMAKKCMKKCLTFSAIKEMQIKTALRFTSFLLEWLSSRTTKTNVGEDLGEKETSYTVGGM
jgi:hypothetical protein